MNEQTLPHVKYDGLLLHYESISILNWHTLLAWTHTGQTMQRSVGALPKGDSTGFMAEFAVGACWFPA